MHPRSRTLVKNIYHISLSIVVLIYGAEVSQSYLISFLPSPSSSHCFADAHCSLALAMGSSASSLCLGA